MIGDLKPYSEVRHSGVPWLGEIPKHWEMLPNRALFREVKDRGHPEEQMLSVTITEGIIRQRELLAGTAKKDSSNLDRSAYKLVRPGDIVYNKMRAWQGAVGVSNYRGIVSPAYVVHRPVGEAESRYLHYLLRTPAFAKEAERWSYGITSDMWSLRPEHFKMIYSCLPPPHEQAIIVRFLDHVDQRIRRYIRAKQKLIKLLEEQKQAIVHRAVTRGFDPDVRLKPTGVEWLGKVPEHWKVVLLGRCLESIEQGWSPLAAEGELLPEQWAVLTLSSVRHGVFDAAAVKPIPVTASVPASLAVRDRDLLLTRSNTRELVGDVCVVDSPRPRTILSDLIYRIVLKSRSLRRRFLMLQLLSPIGRRQIEQDARGSSGTMPKISQRHIRAWRVLMPPLGEQDAIVASVDDHWGPVADALGHAQREIALLREYRTRLIADVVTGKLDVRAVSASLPNKDEDLEPLDEVEDDPVAEPPANDFDLVLQHGKG